MKAVRFLEPKGFEGIDGLVYEVAPDPRPAIGDALVQVHAASFTPTELMWPLSTDRAGHDRGVAVPAHEGSGVVVELGYGTAGVSVGDEVYGLIDGYRDGCGGRVRGHRGSQPGAEADDGRLRPGRSHSTGHAHLVAGTVRPRSARVGPDGGHSRRRRRGGVDGGVPRPLGRRPRDRNRPSEGAPNACSTWAQRIRRRRAGRLGDRRRPRRPRLRHHRRRRAHPFRPLVKPGGTLVTIMAPPPTDRTAISARSGSFVTPNGSQLREIARLVDDGTLHPQVDAIYPLADAREAFVAKSTQHLSGKVVLTP